MDIKQFARRGRERLCGGVASHPVATRWILAGPVGLAASVATMMAMPVWLPAGAAGVNNIALPLILMPLLWAVPFFYACLEANLMRGTAILTGAVVVQSAVVALAV